jgi:phenylalanine-4-hydroxylase
VEIDGGSVSSAGVHDIVEGLKGAGVKSVQVVGGDRSSSGSSHRAEEAVPWFPRRLSDLDTFAERTLQYGGELSADHPGFTDAEYRRRRAEITDIARNYRSYPVVEQVVLADNHM